MSRVMCVSHIADVDGCVCAALLRRALKADFQLASYGNLNECLRTIRDIYDLVIICDIGLREANLKELKRIRRFANTMYIDHHPLDTALSEELKAMGVQVIHDPRDCASFLTFMKFQGCLPREASLLASYAAVSDRLEDGPVSREILPRYARDFLFFEAMILSHAFENKKRSNTLFKRDVVRHLSLLEYPHRIKALPKISLEHIERIAVLRDELPVRTSRLGNIASVEAGEDSASTVANLLLDVCDANVGICYNMDSNEGVADLSIRARWSLDVDVGRITKELAESFGGFGGGHPKACGARIPAQRLNDFILALNKYLEQM